MQILTAARAFVGAMTLFGTISIAAESTLPVCKTILDNGLTILIREDHSAPVVSAQAWCRAGSITEGKYMGAGISHVLEHMLFKGTTTRAVGDIPHAVLRAGHHPGRAAASQPSRTPRRRADPNHASRPRLACAGRDRPGCAGTRRARDYRR